VVSCLKRGGVVGNREIPVRVMWGEGLAQRCDSGELPIGCKNPGKKGFLSGGGFISGKGGVYLKGKAEKEGR